MERLFLIYCLLTNLVLDGFYATALPFSQLVLGLDFANMGLNFANGSTVKFLFITHSLNCIFTFSLTSFHDRW